MWVLGAEFEFSVRAVHAPDDGASSPVLNLSFPPLYAFNISCLITLARISVQR